MATQLETPPQRPRPRLPGDVNIWIFVLADLFSFAFYFVVFMIYRVEHGPEFLAGQRHLDLTLATINTLVLLASSRFVALAVLRMRNGDADRARRAVYFGAICGVVFVAIKLVEWQHEIANGYTLATDNFFMFYFALTGVHLFHVLLGLLVLGFLAHELREPRLRRESVVESGAVYWHMVDLVWIVLFALLYLMR